MTSSASPPFTFPGQTEFYRGKVRDVYSLTNSRLVMIASNRISAFDVILPQLIPYKGQVLNQLAAYFLQHAASILPVWLLSVPDPVASVGLKCVPYPIEFVVRGYLAGHAWRLYQAGSRTICGIALPDHLVENDPLPQPILTPSTKAATGHDEDISKEEILKKGLVSPSDWKQLEHYSFALFDQGSRLAQEKGLVLVDTKYEFGRFEGMIYLMDELHTPDSSRYFYADTSLEGATDGLPRRQLSKEFVRKWLMDHDFQGLPGQHVPTMSPDFVDTVSMRYIELYEKITGQPFVPSDHGADSPQIFENILAYLTANRSLL